MPQTPNTDYFRKIQVNFIAPFATDVIIDPTELAINGARRTQVLLLDGLQCSQKTKVLPFEIRPLDIKGPDEQDNELLYVPTHHPDKTLYPIEFLTATLDGEQLAKLQHSQADLKCKFEPENSWKAKYTLEIKQVQINLYHYGFGNITISTVLTTPEPLEFVPGSEDDLGLRYRRLAEFVESCSFPEDDKESYPVVQQFETLIKELRDTIQTKVAEHKNLSAARKQYHTQLESYRKASKLNSNGFLWVHRLYFLPVSPDVDHNSLYEQAAIQAFCNMTEGTSIDGLTHQLCRTVRITPGSSFALVADLCPVGEALGADDGSTSTADDIVAGPLSNIIQTAGVHDAVSIELATSLDVVTDAYQSSDKRTRHQIADSDITDALQRISHTRALVTQYDEALPPVSKKILAAIKQEWHKPQRWEYIDWKFEALRDLHDRKKQQELNTTAFHFSLIAAIGVFLSLLGLMIGAITDHPSTSQLIWVAASFAVFFLLAPFYFKGMQKCFKLAQNLFKRSA